MKRSFVEAMRRLPEPDLTEANVRALVGDLSTAATWTVRIVERVLRRGKVWDVELHTSSWPRRAWLCVRGNAAEAAHAAAKYRALIVEAIGKGG